MTTLPTETTDRQLAADFLSEWTICRRALQSYPASHPSVGAAVEKVLRRLGPLVGEAGQVVFGVTRRGLLLNGSPLGADNPRFQELASTLLSYGVIALTVTAALTEDDLRKLDAILGTPRGEVWARGGIRKAFADAAMGGVKVTAINPAVFLLSDQLDAGAEEPWDLFVRRLLDGYFSLTREMLVALLAAPPGDLGREFDTVVAGVPREASHQSVKSIADFFAGLDRRDGGDGLSDEMVENICGFVAGLSPELRADFLVVVARSTQTAPRLSERLLSRMPGAELARAVELLAAQGETPPERLVELMQRLSAEAGANSDLDAAIRAEGAPARAEALFRRGELERFVPPSYRELLAAVLSTDRLPAAELEALGELRSTLELDASERKAAAVLAEVAKAVPLEEQGEGIRRNLAELAAHFLGSGDFAAVEKLCRTLLAGDAETGGEKFIDPAFVECVLDTAASRGRESFDGVRRIITAVGRPFVGALLGRLAEEKGLPTRRFWFDCLTRLGGLVRDQALRLAADERWYVKRNVVILLRSSNDAEVQRQVRKLAEHPDPRVRNEAMKNLLRYGDRNAHRLLLAELGSADPARVLAAVKNSEMSDNPEVAEKLLAILDAGGFRPYGVDVKCAAAQSLAGAGNRKALPRFAALLRSSSLFHGARLRQLKAELLRLLASYPAAEVRPLLKELAAAGGDTGALAADTLKRLH